MTLRKKQIVKDLRNGTLVLAVTKIVKKTINVQRRHPYE